MARAVRAAAAALQADELSIEKRPALPRRGARTTQAGRAVNPAAALALRTRQMADDLADYVARTITASEARGGLDGIGWARQIAVLDAKEAGQMHATEYLEALRAFDAGAAALAHVLNP